MSKNDPLLEKSLGERLAHLKQAIESARADSPLKASRTELMGASKMQSADRIEESIGAGLKWFGENRVQEAEEKWPTLKAKYGDVQLHLIGPLQTNKVKDAVKLFDAIQSVDRVKLADELAREMQKQKRTLDVFIQVNTGEEDQKGGVLPRNVDALIQHVHELKLNLVGLMCIPPAEEYPAPHFALLRKIALEHNLKQLSMGMSGDYELAARMGATIVRVGSALFGERK